jgi:hypothetical protein
MELIYFVVFKEHFILQFRYFFVFCHSTSFLIGRVCFIQRFSYRDVGINDVLKFLKFFSYLKHYILRPYQSR